MVSCAVADVKRAVDMGACLTIPQMFLCGFFVRSAQMPTLLRWMQYVCNFKYSLDLSMIIEFSDCDGGPGVQERSKVLLSENGIEPADWWVYLLVLVAFNVAYRTAAMLSLKASALTIYE